MLRSVHNKPMLWILKQEGSMVVCTEMEIAACLLAVMPSGFDLAGLDLTYTLLTDR